jgi:two-component system LytT family response regulator
MAPIRTLLVDDEPLALRSLEAVLRPDPELELVGTCATGSEAVRTIQQLSPDLVFLDIQMPGIGGLDVVRRIAAPKPPLVVFVTAFDHHALEAFSVHALDYVLKPFSDERLLAALQRAKAILRDRTLEELGARLLRLADAARPPEPRYLQRILVQEPSRVRIVATAEIEWIGAAKNYVEIHTARESLLHRQTMDAMDAALDPDAFVRIHRSTIVAVDRVQVVQAEGYASRAVVLHDGTRLPVSRSQVERLMGALSRVPGR